MICLIKYLDTLYKIKINCKALSKFNNNKTGKLRVTAQ